MEKAVEVAVAAILPKIVEAGIDAVKAALSRHKALLATSEAELKATLEAHRTVTRKWAGQVSFAYYPAGRKTDDIFVPLDIYLNRLRSRLDDEDLPAVPLEQALDEDSKSVIILGQPGAGKTTALKHIFQRFDLESTFLAQYQLVLRLDLRDINASTATKVPEYVRRSIEELLGFQISFPDNLQGDENAGVRRALREKVVVAWLNQTKTLLFLDGFDEITLKAKRDVTLQELRTLAPQLDGSAFILTARTGEFNFHLESVQTFEIKPFDRTQIALYATRWLGEDHAVKFMQQLEKTPYADTAIRPLTLAHLCAIYDRYKRIADKPKSIYRRIIRLLLEDWDVERSISRESSYANFEGDRKAEFLASLAYTLTTTLKTSSFSRDGLISSYFAIYQDFGLPRGEASKVVDELESHTGLFLQSGIDAFEFSHKSLQEFLTAEYMVKLAEIPSNFTELQLLPNELAIAVAISSKPSGYFTSLVTEHFRKFRMSFQFTRVFVSRLLIEAPDFEYSPRVGAALLSLYSQYLSAWVEESEQMTLFVIDSLGEEFTYLAERIHGRLELNELLKSYKRTETTHTFDGDPIWRLRKRQRKQSTLITTSESLLPMELWVRESLLPPLAPRSEEPQSSNE